MLSKQKKEYYTKNINQMLLKNKEYYNENKDNIILQHKIYRDDNKEKLQEYERNRPNKQERALKGKEPVICCCGCISTKIHLPRHQRTQKHHELLEQQINSILIFLKCFNDFL